MKIDFRMTTNFKDILQTLLIMNFDLNILSYIFRFLSYVSKSQSHYYMWLIILIKVTVYLPIYLKLVNSF